MTQRETLKVLYPGAAPETIPVREKLLTARDVAAGRIAHWDDWNPDYQAPHRLVTYWAGRAALSPWPAEDLNDAVTACRHLLTATLILNRLGENYGE